MVGNRILIIDDDTELCEELMESFKGEGYSPAYTSDVVKGEGLIRAGDYDTVLLDYKMPALTGVDMLKKLKADNVRKRIFIITGKPFVERALREEGLSDMVSGVISKPINFEALLEKIKNTRA